MTQGLGNVAGLQLVYCEPDNVGLSNEEFVNGSSDALTLSFKLKPLAVEDNHGETLPPLLQQNRDIWDLEEAPVGVPECKNCDLLEGLLAVCSP